ncbi:MAG: methionine ABC transporter ATP-binding protein [Clostridia bacterium]|nr:methionine ABC transporter ATP-binding protein [Clostridia bacterium]
MIEIRELKKSFQGLEVLKGISLSIQDGEIYGIIGQSGAGKSTLLRCVNGLEAYDSGDLIVDGVRVDVREKASLRELQKRMGMIFQSFNLLERLDVYQNVALPLKFWGINPRSPESRRKIEDLIRLVGLEDKIHARPRELSGGQKQRVAIARALVLDPQFLLCDEATSALDPEITKGILALLQKINRELGITIVVVTHQMEVVKQICNRIAFLSNGKVLSEGKPEELFVMPTQEEIRQFLRDGSSLLPKSGVNVQLYFFDETSEEPIVTEMARRLGKNFNIVWAKLEDFRENVYGSLVLNIQEADVQEVGAFLDQNHIHWEVLP